METATAAPTTDNELTTIELPRTLSDWRTFYPEDELWYKLRLAFHQQGYTLWDALETQSGLLSEPREGLKLSSGFAYVTPLRGSGVYKDKYFEEFTVFPYSNGLIRAARTRDGHDVVVRVIAIGEQGQRHSKILKTLAQGKLSFLSSNHTIPMFAELSIRDATFGIFPMVGFPLWLAYGSWPRNSVGDILDMIMQALEGLAFIHSQRIAHRDAFKSNFLIEWFPESLTAKPMTVSRPRVYLIDFEVAIDFPEDCPPDQRVCVGIPSDGSLTSPDEYERQRPPEVESGLPYDPFKLDVWQLGASFADFSSTIESIDKVLAEFIDLNAETRPTAAKGLEKLVEVVSAIPPKELLIPPVVFDLTGPQPEVIHFNFTD